MLSFVLCSLSMPVLNSSSNNMTKEEHKNAIIAQIQQQNLNVLVDSLAAALAEIESLKAKPKTEE